METITLEIHEHDILYLTRIIKRLKKNGKITIKLDYWDNLKESLIK